MLHMAAIGVGYIDKVHAAAVAAHPQARLVLVRDPFIEAAKVLAEPLGAHALTDTAEVFSVDDVNVVVVDSPTPLHIGHILAVARAGKTALYEKPIAPSVEATRVLADELATFEHPPVMVDFQCHYGPSIMKTQQFVAEGRIGCIEQLTIVSRDLTPPSAGYLAQSGGVFKNMAVHDFNEARFFLGEIVSVNAIGRRLGPASADVGNFDGTVTTLRAISDVVTIIKSACHCVSGYDQKAEIFGSKDEVVAEDLCMTSVQVNDATGSAQQEVYLDLLLERYADAYRDELTAFIDTVNNDSPVTLTVEDGVAALVLAEAAERSVHSGQTMEVTK